MGAGAVPVSLLVASHRELGDMGAHVAVHQLEEHGAASLAAGLPGDGLDVGHIGNEIGFQHTVVVETRVAAKVLVVIEPVPEGEGIVHDEFFVVEDVVDQRRVGSRCEPARSVIKFDGQQ